MQLQGRSENVEQYAMTSQVWRGIAWTHTIVVVTPAIVMDNATAVLYVTGGDPNELDIREAQEIADNSGLRVALLFNIPNQPIWDRWEDDLVAHTFEQYIDSGDVTWPLLFPMTRAAIRAMDLLESQTPAQRFVVTGASKRGWTTWLAAATGDPRIAGVAPMVIDNLNFPAQMCHQVESWGGYSEQIEDYTSRDLQDEMNSVRGTQLTVMMDPINYIDRIQCPILIVNGTNDRYWTVDALSLYWDELPPSKRCLIVPNVGHILGDKVRMVETLCAFAAACARRELLPEVVAEYVCSDSHVGARVTVSGASSREFPETILWAAFSESLDFRDSEWLVESWGKFYRAPSEWTVHPNGMITATPDMPEPNDSPMWSMFFPDRPLTHGGFTSGVSTSDEVDDGSPYCLHMARRIDADRGNSRQNVAVMVEVRFPQGYSLTSPVRVFRAT